MRLIEAINEMDSFDDTHTIYASSPFNADSDAFIAREPEAGGLPCHANGFTYFLEVVIAREFLTDWIVAQDHVPTLNEQCIRLIQYAVNDA